MSTGKTKNKVNTRRAILLRAYLVFGIALVFGLAIVISVARLQMRSDEEFSKTLKLKNTRVVTVEAIRGNIYAGNGSLLATSVPEYNMVFDANADGLTNQIFKGGIDSLSLLMSQQFPSKTADGWKQHFIELRRKKSRYSVLAKDLGYDVVRVMKTWPIIREGKFKSGVWYEEFGKRLYFMGDLAKRTIGTSKNGVSNGLEGAFDSLLAGRNGQRMEQRMPGNVWRPVQVGNFKDPQNGNDIVTTLDINVQDVAQYALQKVLAENEADHGCVLVMEVNTGAIKAIANLKRGKDGKYYQAQNYAIDEFTEPGSTFKLVSTLALLESGKCKATDSVDIEWGETKFYGETMKDASKSNKRIITLQEAFEKSSNVGISKLVQKHFGKEPQNFIDYSLNLGLNIKPDFDIKASGNPRIKTKKSSDWAATSLPFMSIGYEIRLSPLQVLMLYNGIANNGKLVKPFMVKEIRREGQLISKIEPVVLVEKMCNPESLKALKSMMEGVVENGTATNLKNTNYKVAGKTGTAQIAKGASGYDHSSYKASFVGYFPAENPQYSMIVVINEPRKGKYYGALVAGPVFKEVADKLYSSSLKLLPVLPIASKPTMPFILNGSQKHTKTILNIFGISSHTDTSNVIASWIKPIAGEYSITLKSFEENPGKIPSVVGMGLRDALFILENKKLNVTFSGYGRVTSQSISAGTILTPGSTIQLTLTPF